MKNKSKTSQNHIRIIAGDFRGRLITFHSVDDLRPTGARIRETLFNWLAPVIQGKHCLDLFAGSGILGFEALSRGASQVTFVEKNRQQAAQIAKNIELLKIDNAKVIPSDYKQVLMESAADIIFLDPPYKLRLLPQLLEDIYSLSAQYVFIEDNQPFDAWITELPMYEVIKSQKAGNIYYGILCPVSA